MKKPNEKIITAVKDGNLTSMQKLLSGGADPNARDEIGEPILLLGAYNGNTEVVKLLLEKGADVNVKRADDGTTALWIASYEGKTEVVKLLLEKGADVNVKDKDGVTAVSYTHLTLPTIYSV